MNPNSTYASTAGSPPTSTTTTVATNTAFTTSSNSIESRLSSAITAPVATNANTHRTVLAPVPIPPAAPLPSVPVEVRRRRFTIGADTTDEEDGGSGSGDTTSSGGSEGKLGVAGSLSFKEVGRRYSGGASGNSGRWGGIGGGGGALGGAGASRAIVGAEKAVIAQRKRRRGRSLRKNVLLPRLNLDGAGNGVGLGVGTGLGIATGAGINGTAGNAGYSNGYGINGGAGLRRDVVGATATMGQGSGTQVAGSSVAIYDSQDESDRAAAYGDVRGANRYSYPVRGRSGSVVMVMPRTRQEELDSAADTAYWGWVVFGATWIVFVVGMGSVLGVWEWAWDVGESPFPESTVDDDDEGAFPIPGYYPALMILTCVMAWVWVVVAWVGMKYFKHAKIQPPSDDT